MKRFLLFVCVLSFFACALPSHGVEPGYNYLTLKPGIYSPQSNDLDNFDNGFNGEIAIGRRFNPNMALEMGLGYFNTKAEFAAAGPGFYLREKDSLDVVPITLSLKAIVPVNRFEFFGIGGIGAYYVYGDLKLSGAVGGTSGRLSLDGEDWVFGCHLGLGFHYNISPTMFIGAEGKYLWTSEARLEDTFWQIPISTKFKMDGILATAVIGFKF